MQAASKMDILPDDTLQWMWDDVGFLFATNMLWSSATNRLDTMYDLTKHADNPRPVRVSIRRAGVVLNVARFKTVAEALDALTPQAQDTPGVYTISHEARVSQSKTIKVETDAEWSNASWLSKGATVTVLEVVEVSHQHRVRAKIENPNGWISLLDTSTGHRWAEKVRHEQAKVDANEETQGIDAVVDTEVSEALPVITDEEVNMGGTLVPTAAPGWIAGTGIEAMLPQRTGVAPPPPLETFAAYSKKGEESTGVLTMLDMMVPDLDKEREQAPTSIGGASRGKQPALPSMGWAAARLPADTAISVAHTSTALYIPPKEEEEKSKPKKELGIVAFRLEDPCKSSLGSISSEALAIQQAKRPSAFSCWSRSRMPSASDPILFDPDISIAGTFRAQESTFPAAHRRFWSAACSAGHRRPLATSYLKIDVSMLMLPVAGRHPRVQMTKTSPSPHRTQATTTFGSDRCPDGLRVYAFMGAVEVAETNTIKNYRMYRELPCQFYGITTCSVQARLSLPSTQQLITSAVLPRMLVKGPVDDAVIGGHSLGCLVTCVLALHLEECGRAPRSLFRIDGRDIAPTRRIDRMLTRQESIISPRQQVSNAVSDMVIGKLIAGERAVLVMNVDEVPKMRPVTYSVHFACKLTKAESLMAGNKAQPRAELRNLTAGSFIIEDTKHNPIAADMHWDIARRLRQSLQKDNTNAALPHERTNDDAAFSLQRAGSPERSGSLSPLPADEPNAQVPPAQKDDKMNTTSAI